MIKRYLRGGALSLAMAMVIVTNVSAERNWHPNSSFELGGKVGVIFSGLTGNGVDVLEDKLRRQFSVLTDETYIWVIGGVSFSLALNQYVSVQPEILYHRNGKKYEGRIDGDIRKFEFELDYLTIPVLFRLNLPTGTILRPNAYVGPHISFRINADVDGLEELPTQTQDLGILTEIGPGNDIDDETRLVDIGVSAGIGLDIKLGPGYFTFEARYMRGFVEIFDDDEVTENAEDIWNQSLSLLGGYMYAF